MSLASSVRKLLASLLAGGDKFAIQTWRWDKKKQDFPIKNGGFRSIFNIDATYLPDVI